MTLITENKRLIGQVRRYSHKANCTAGARDWGPDCRARRLSHAAGDDGGTCTARLLCEAHAPRQSGQGNALSRPVRVCVVLQVSDMRSQLQRMDGDLWQAKQEVANQLRQQQSRKPVVHKERPQWVEPKAPKADAGLQVHTYDMYWLLLLLLRLAGRVAR